MPTWTAPRLPPPPSTKAVPGVGFRNSRTDMFYVPPARWSARRRAETMAHTGHLPGRWGLVLRLRPRETTLPRPLGALHEVPATPHVLDIEGQCT